MTTDYSSFHQKMVKNLPFGYALVKSIKNEQEQIIDYQYLEVNSIFSQIVNQSITNLRTRLASNVTPYEYTNFLRFFKKFYTFPGLEQQEFEFFSVAHQSWYKVWIYTPEEGHFIIHCFDIQKEKELIEKEKEHDLRFKLLINANPDVMCFKDGEGRWLIANEAMIKLFDMDFLDYFYKTDAELSNISNSQYVPAFLTCTGSDEKTWKSKKIYINEEIIKTPQGEEKIYEFIKAPVFEDNGARKGLIVIGRDITHRKSTELELKNAIAEAESANRVKSNFLANMSHEIRTPLNSIIGFTDLLKDFSASEEQKTYIRNANTAGHSLLSLLDNILDLSKLQANKMEINPIPTDVTLFAQEVIDIVNYNALYKGLSVMLSVNKDIPKIVHLDAGLVKQVLINLLGNAIKFTNQGKVILSIKFRAVDDSMGNFHFSVKDTGIGIDPNVKNQLFQAFTQADSSTKKKYGGTGLGLAISQRIVQKMGGHIEIESEPNKGSTFYFTLKMPFEKDAKIDIQSNHSTSKYQVFETDYKPTIMIVEDNSMNMLISSKLLKTLVPQSNILKAFNGKEAVSLSKKEEIDLIFMDIRMPEMDGIEATKIIRAAGVNATKKVPIIALTAGATKEEVKYCLDSGMNEYLIKPFKREDLFQLIQKYLPKSRKAEQNKKLTSARP